ncbi:hypothetical protein Hanom_Chr16g01486891 [Helianthus anomalus]
MMPRGGVRGSHDLVKRDKPLGEVKKEEVDLMFIFGFGYCSCFVHPWLLGG